jgi:hypothetical protein
MGTSYLIIYEVYHVDFRPQRSNWYIFIHFKYLAFALALQSKKDFQDGNGDVILVITLLYALFTV